MKNSRDVSALDLLKRGCVRDFFKKRKKVTEDSGIGVHGLRLPNPMSDAKSEATQLGLLQCITYTGKIISISGKEVLFTADSLSSGITKQPKEVPIKPITLSITLENKDKEELFGHFFGGTIVVSLYTFIWRKKSCPEVKNAQYVLLKKGNEQISWGTSPDAYRYQC